MLCPNLESGLGAISDVAFQHKAAGSVRKISVLLQDYIAVTCTVRIVSLRKLQSSWPRKAVCDLDWSCLLRTTV